MRIVTNLYVLKGCDFYFVSVSWSS